MITLICSALLVVFLAYILFAMAVYLFQERLIFPGRKLNPSHQFIDLSGLEEKWVKVDGAILSTLHFSQPGARGLIFFLHGNVGNLDRWVPDVDFYRREKYDLFMLDYRGYGKSSGRIQSQVQLEADVRTAWESIAATYCDKKLPVVIYGRSIGTYLAAKLALEVESQLLVLVSPYTSLLAMARLKFPWLPARLLRYPLATDDIIAQVKAPVLIVHGEDDPLIPVSHAHRLANKSYRAKLVIIDGAVHNDIHEHEAYTAAVSSALP